MARKKANEGGGLVWCHDTGTTCITFAKDDEESSAPLPRYFARADKQSPIFDTALDELSKSLNDLVADTEAREKREKNRDGKLKIGFLLTGWGFLPVWKRDVSSAERLADLVDPNSLTDLDAMTNAQLNAYLRFDKPITDRKEAVRTGAGEWRRHRTASGVIICRGAGKSCFVTALEAEVLREAGFLSADSDPVSSYFPTVDASSPVFDPALRDLADNLNTMVADVQAREKRNSDKDRRLRIGFLVTGSGFLPVWKIVLNDTDVYGSEVDTVDLEAMTDEQRDGYLRLAAQ